MTEVSIPGSSRPARTLEARSPAAGWILGAVIALFVAVAVYQQAPPAPLPEGTPPESFSASRAMRHLRVIARSPHPVGSAEHGAVRDYLVNELNALGLATEVQRATGIGPRRSDGYRVGAVQNIIARVPGTGQGEAVLLAAHYDSGPNAPGASDDGSGVAALLETARALKATPPLKNDVVLLFTDGEEPGLLGAAAFVRHHPAAQGLRVVLNFEARGSGGPVFMFETSEDNGWLIREFARAAPRPIGTSLSYEIYKRLPNDTDLTIFKRAGLKGLNFAFINGLNRYHTAADSVENIDERSLQAHGSYALALARHFGNLDAVRNEAGNAVYFNFLGPTLIHYPEWLVVPLAALAALIFVGVVALGLRRGTLKARGMLLGFVALLACGVASWLAVTLAWRAASTLHEGFDSVPWGDVYNSWLYVLSFVFLALAVSSVLYNLLRRRADGYSLAIGALGWWLLLAVSTSLFVPGGSYLFTLPLLCALVGLGVLLAGEGGGCLKAPLVLAAYAIPGVVLMTTLISQVFPALTLAASGTIIILEVLLLGLLFPHLDLLASPRRWLLPSACALLAAGFMLAGLLTAGFDRSRPKVVNVFYALDADTGAAVWGSNDKRPDEWSAQFFGAGDKKDTLTNLFPLNKRPLLNSAAPPLALPAPQVTVLHDSTAQGVRSVRLRITSPRGGDILAVYADAGSEVVTAAVDGEPIKPDAPPGRDVAPAPWAMTYYALPEGGVELTLGVKEGQPLRLRVDDRTYGLPQIAEKPMTAKPDYIVPSPSWLSEMTVVSKTYTF
ncbi:MAG: M28 family metallopeptidase [Acidobacteriota bacterium]|nr:M28 family metallopeptidase [Acidobacteriota bacterium]